MSWFRLSCEHNSMKSQNMLVSQNPYCYLKKKKKDVLTETHRDAWKHHNKMQACTHTIRQTHTHNSPANVCQSSKHKYNSDQVLDETVSLPSTFLHNSYIWGLEMSLIALRWTLSRNCPFCNDTAKTDREMQAHRRCQTVRRICRHSQTLAVSLQNKHVHTSGPLQDRLQAVPESREL